MSIKEFTKKEKELIIDLFIEELMSPEDIAKELNLDEDQVMKYCINEIL